MLTPGPWFTGQIPAGDLIITVKDFVSDEGRALSDYTSASLLLLDPEGEAVVTTGGTCTLGATTVTYNWPATSLFATAGDYKLQVKLVATGVIDYTVPMIIEIKEALA